MTLKIGWSHDPENLSATPAGGPMTLKTGGPFRLKISARRWSLHGENRHSQRRLYYFLALADQKAVHLPRPREW